MQAERDHLIKFIFPQLRKICERRGVAWSEVDLRWGITDEQADEGKVLPICLEEIQRCRPYFIGILGERYGWVPDEIDQELVEQQPWLEEHKQRSVTELEILHGVLNNPQMEQQAFFYFRDPEAMRDDTDRYRETLTLKEVALYGPEAAQERLAARKQKLAALKERIQNSDFPVKTGFTTPQELGEWVLEDLKNVIDRLYPEEFLVDPMRSEVAQHLPFAEKKRDVYVGGEQYYPVLDQAAAVGKPVIVVGEPGSGKTALLANWGLRYQEDNPNDLVIMHFIGASASSSRWAGTLRLIMSQLNERCRLGELILPDNNELRKEFPRWLQRAARSRKVVLVIDGVDQLEDRQGAQELTWLPNELPQNTSIIISSYGEKCIHAAEGKGFASLQIKTLGQSEREQLVTQYLSLYSKKLNAGRVQRIIQDPKNGNPLALRIVINELRQFGVHERLDSIIDSFIAARSIPEMLDLVLERCEKDFEEDCPMIFFVGNALRLIWAAREGISEAELLDILGRDGEPFPQRSWSPLYIALEEFLIERDGLINFSHAFFKQAVEKRYASEYLIRRFTHYFFVEYFQAMEGFSIHKVKELPWHLREMEEWEALSKVLTDIKFFEFLWEMDRDELYSYWTSIEENSDIRRVEAYQDLINRSQSSDRLVLNWLAILFLNSGNSKAAMQIFKRVELFCEQTESMQGLSACYGNQASILKDWGKMDEALQMYKKQEAMCRCLEDMKGVQTSRGNQALVLEGWGKLEEANQIYRENESLYRQHGNLNGLQLSLYRQAMICQRKGELEKALDLFKKQEKICIDLDNKVGLLDSWNGQGLILQAWGRLKEALVLHERAEKMSREMGNLKILEVSLGNLALIHESLGDLQKSMTIHQEEEFLCRKLNNLSGLERSLGNQAVILREWGQLDKALNLMKEQERIARQLDKPESLHVSLNNQGLILQQRGKLKDAMAYYQEAEQICRQIGDQKGIAIALTNRATILILYAQNEEAMELLQEQELICNTLGDMHGLCTCWVNQAFIYGRNGNQAKRKMLLQNALIKSMVCGYVPLTAKINAILNDE